MPQTARVALERLDPSPTPSTDDALGWLQNAHGRIRRFAELAVCLAERPFDACNAQDVAADLHRYFGLAVALHMRDEDESLAPRLARVAPLELADGLANQSREHAEHALALKTLLPMWNDLARGRTVDPVALAHQSEGLRDELLRHLSAEERDVFPLVRRLLPSTLLQRICAEMRARRSTNDLRAARD